MNKKVFRFKTVECHFKCWIKVYLHEYDHVAIKVKTEILTVFSLILHIIKPSRNDLKRLSY